MTGRLSARRTPVARLTCRAHLRTKLQVELLHASVVSTTTGKKSHLTARHNSRAQFPFLWYLVLHPLTARYRCGSWAFISGPLGGAADLLVTGPNKVYPQPVDV